ncbi:MAG: hypothetical protein WED00_02830 [Aquisalimonadaceae bacterium]
MPIRLAWEAPDAGAFINTATPALVLVPSREVDPERVRFELAGEPFEVDCTAENEALHCQPSAPLPEGEAQLSAAIPRTGRELDTHSLY